MFFARKNRKLLRNSYGFLSGKTLSRGQPSSDFRYVRDKTTRYLLCQVARPGCRDPQEVYESELVDKATNYCNRCFQKDFFWTLLILDSFYDYSVGQLDVVWGDLVQKRCQICRKSESSVMSACEWSSESEPHRFVGAPSKSDPFDPKRTADSQAETEDPFAKAHGFWSIFWGGKSSPNGRSKSPCLDSLVSWAKSWNCWPPETCWNLLKLWSSGPSPFLDFFSLFLDGTSHDESHAVHKDQTCWAIVRIFHFVTLITFISKIYFYLIFFEICDILLWLSLRFNGKRQKMLKTLQVSKLAPCHVDKAGHRLPACAWQYLQKMAMYISQLHGWMFKKTYVIRDFVHWYLKRTYRFSQSSLKSSYRGDFPTSKKPGAKLPPFFFFWPQKNSHLPPLSGWSSQFLESSL